MLFHSIGYLSPWFGYYFLCFLGYYDFNGLLGRAQCFLAGHKCTQAAEKFSCLLVIRGSCLRSLS